MKKKKYFSLLFNNEGILSVRRRRDTFKFVQKEKERKKEKNIMHVHKMAAMRCTVLCVYFLRNIVRKASIKERHKNIF